MFSSLKQLLRLFTIYQVIVRYGLDELLFTSPLLRRLRLLLYLTPGHWVSRKNLTRGAKMRLALEELGPIFIKFGQILSTRRDLLPSDVARELSKLQDNVKPFCGNQARQLIENAYNQPVHAIFAEFNTEPMAAASIAQVHAARLHDGRDVVVKVVRPGIEKQIQKDIALMYLLARLINRYWQDGRRLRPIEVVQEFEKNIYAELDLVQEGANCTQLRRNFRGSDELYIPEVDWKLTHTNVMVMERIYGISVNDIETLRERGTNFKRLAEIGVEVFFTQVFRDNFFHADMHPGNVFINADDPANPYYIAIDFGIMGTLSSEDQHYLAANFLAFFQRDYHRVAELHVDSGWVPNTTRVEEFEGAIRSVCEPYFDKPLKDISFGLVLLRLFQTARRFNMVIQPQLVLLQKTLLNIEGLGRELYPDLDLWQTAKPFLERWMDERMGMRAFWRGLQRNLPLLAEKLPDMPLLVYDALQDKTKEEARLQALQTELALLREQIRQQQTQQSLRYTAGVLLAAGALLLALQPEQTSHLVWLEILLVSVGGGMLVMAWRRA